MGYPTPKFLSKTPTSLTSSIPTPMDYLKGKTVSFELTLANTQKHLICDLTPNKKYPIVGAHTKTSHLIIQNDVGKLIGILPKPASCPYLGGKTGPKWIISLTKTNKYYK